MIESAQNENFKRLIDLLSSRGIKKHGQFLVFGQKNIQEILKDNPAQVVEIVKKTTDPLYAPRTIRTTELNNTLFKELDVFGTNAPILVCETPEIPEWNPGLTVEGIELLCPVGDPSNVGALLRSALAFGVSRIVLLTEAAHPFHPRSIRAMSTNPFNLKIYRGPSLDSILANPPAGVLALDGTGESLKKFIWPKNLRLLVGEEGPGFSGELGTIKSLRIDISDQAESLNAMVAASIALFSYRTQHPLVR